MHPIILSQLSQAHTAELRRNAARTRAARSIAPPRPEARARRSRARPPRLMRRRRGMAEPA